MRSPAATGGRLTSPALPEPGREPATEPRTEADELVRIREVTGSGVATGSDVAEDWDVDGDSAAVPHRMQ